MRLTRQGVANLDGPRTVRLGAQAQVVQHHCDRELIAVCDWCKGDWCKERWHGGALCECTHRCKICRRPM